MNKNTRNILRIISIVLAVLIILMELGIISFELKSAVWVMVIAYFMLLLSSSR